MSGVSYGPGTVAAMESDDGIAGARKAYAERLRADIDARLNGLLATLALPAVRGDDGVFRRVPVEIEVEHGVWKPVDMILIDDSLTFVFGTNGHRIEYRFPGDACPPWRVVRARVSRRLVVE